jgi:hypothetical protein
MRNFQTKYVEKIKTHFTFNKCFSPKSYRLWDNVEKHSRPRQATDGNILLRVRFSCWVTKTTDTQLDYVILTAFPQRKWCREHASILRFYIHWLSCIYLFTGMKRIHSVSYTVLLCLDSQAAFASKSYLCCRQPPFLLSTFPVSFYASSWPYCVENISPENVVPLEQQARSPIWHPLCT